MIKFERRNYQTRKVDLKWNLGQFKSSSMEHWFKERPNKKDRSNPKEVGETSRTKMAKWRILQNVGKGQSDPQEKQIKHKDAGYTI